MFSAEASPREMSQAIPRDEPHESSSVKTIEAYQTNVPPKIDGILDDECWKHAKPATGFIQREPNEFEPAEEQTIVYVAYDKDYLYIAFNCLSSQPDKIVANLTVRDSLAPREPFSPMLSLDDAVQVLFDTYHDKRNYYSFMVNPRGTLTDGKSGGGRFGGGTVWDGIWKAKAKIHENGWSAEMAIPFSTLRFKEEEVQTWGINFLRSEKAKGEESYWSRVDDDISNPAGFGELVGLKGISIKRLLNLIPYVTARNGVTTENDESSLEQAEGVDLESLITPNLTASVTFNPDFGQIEADPERFNLSRREFRLPEKRPFFKEGLGLFNTPIGIFYSRRIFDIKYGAKLTGKVGKLNLAALNVQSRGTDEEPEANFSAVRFKRDVSKTATVGVLFSDKYRNNEHNQAWGMDANFRFARNIRIGGQFCKSSLSDVSDSAYTISVMRPSPKSFLFSRYEYIGPDFHVESGFIPQKDRKDLMFGGGYDFPVKKHGIQEIGVRGFFGAETNSENKLREEGFRAGMDFELQNKISMQVGYNRGVELYEEEFHNNAVEIGVGYNKKEFTSSEFSYSQGKLFGDNMRRIRAETHLKPLKQLSVGINLDNLRLNNESTWINIVRLIYNFTPDLYLRAFIQMSRGKLTANMLLNYEYQPGSNLYIAYNRDADGNKVVFVKIVYLLGMYVSL